MLNKRQEMPYLQDFRTVQTNSKKPKVYTGGDATNIVLLGRYKVVTSMGTFDDCIGSKVEIAYLSEIRPLDEAQIEEFKTKYFV